ncbi:uncharacterized protein LOC113045466 isoform X1 [Carassius auratus]|uniref:Uncharacterized protein LOC113045466 isoform X1 n=2 Tax=Carassius auratus TaxID=7957 RepID=A0A6P6JPN9_CARAU|nr:uncharacterized protein LOC113045466 isoform X1 [Carassius auratus]
MTSSGVEAEMEEQYSEGENHKLVSACISSQLGDGSPAKEQSHDQKPMERESPESPSAIKRWEFGPLLQSFKSKMASLTELVMTPVRLFKPSDSLSLITLPDRHEQLIESNAEKAETDKCRNGLFPKRPSSEKVQCSTAPKRSRVAQRWNFCTASTSDNLEPVLDHIQMHGEISPNEETQIDSPSSQSQAILQDGTRNASPCKAQSPHLRTRPNLSTEKLWNSVSAICVSEQSNVQTDPLIVLHHLSGERQTRRTDTACGHSHESYFSEEESNLLKPEYKSSTNKTCANTPDAGVSFSASCDFDLIDKDTSTVGREESFSRMATRKSPRKKHLSGSAGPPSTELASFVKTKGSKTLEVGMKESQLENSTEWTQHLAEISDPPETTTVREVKPKRCRKALQTNKDLEARGKCDVQNAKERRHARNKKVKNNGITLEVNQDEEIFVQVRKKRRGFSAMQPLQDSNVSVGTNNAADGEMRNSVKTSDQMGQDKISRLRKNVKCRMLLTSSNEDDATETTSSQNGIHNVLIDKTMNAPSERQPMQSQEPEVTTETRKTRRHLKSTGVLLQRRNIHLPKHKFEDCVTSVVDPAGPDKPSKITLLPSELSVVAAEKQETCISGLKAEEEIQEILPPVSTAQVDSERKLSRPTKNLIRPRRKEISVAKRIGAVGGNNEAESIEKTTEAVPVLPFSGSGPNRLLRSYSCPEISSLGFSDCHFPQSHTHALSTTSPSRKSSPTPLPIHLHSPSKRTRRHTVCSVEIEREIAPLCLRKEVYPSSPYSPSSSLTALASCFLSSPLAFLSKSSSQGHSYSSATSSGSVSAPSSFNTSSSAPSSFSPPFSSTLPSCHALNGPSPVTPSPVTSVSSICSSVEGDSRVLQMECEESIDEESSHFDLKLSAAFSEEKALSDSEIKTEIKDGQRGKVSSIRIRKKIPKPQNNLTPMGLPKVIRIKKKDFSLEEIYTNKNFSKPPDGRLETIFEVPLHRRDGSQAVLGQKKVKRFVEFPELGVARKPKKPLVGVLAGGGAQRNAGFSRTRRGVGVSSRAEDGLTLQQMESLLCSKLQELDTWMALQQVLG